MWDEATTFVFHVGAVMWAIPANMWFPFFVILISGMLLICLIMSLYNMRIVSFKESIIVTLLFFFAFCSTWYMLYLIQLT